MFKKWLIVLTVPLVLQIFFLLFLFKAQQDAGEYQDWAIHTKVVIGEAEIFTRLLISLRSNALGLILSRNERVNPYEEIAGQIPEKLKTLHDLVSDKQSQQGSIDQIGEKTKEYLAWVDETIRLERSGQHEAAIERVKTQEGKVVLDEIRVMIDRFLKVEAGFDEERLDRLARLRTWQNQAIVVGTIVTFVTALALVSAFSKGVSRRIDNLAQNARRLAEGKALSPPLKGDDEIVQLDAVFHSMAKALAERDQENEMFIYSVSHDLRSPLVNLQGFSKELAYTCDDLRVAVGALEKSAEADRKFAKLDDEMKQSIHFIQTAVSRLSGIIDSLLRLSRAGRVEYRVQEVDVADTVARVVEAQDSTTKQQGAEIKIGPLPATWGDPTVIEQVFGNLLSNAVKYLDPNRPGVIEVGAEDEPSGEFRTFYVKDNGLGIAKNHQSKLFHAFQRLHPSAAPGEGIGLALVRRMVERHGGKIWADSEAGVGTTFFLTLPAHAPTALMNGRTPTLTAGMGRNT